MKRAALILLIALAGCNVRKFLQPGQQLYTGASVTVRSRDHVDEKQIRKTLEKVLFPKPNQTIFGIRFKLWFYYKAGENPKGKIRKWFRTEAGEPPVFYEARIPGDVSAVMENRLANLGYFDARVTHTVVESAQKVRIEYQATVTRPYTISEVLLPQGDDGVSTVIRQEAENTLLKQGAPYSLDVIRNERVRLDLALKNSGYFFFNPDYILFRADSTVGDKRVRLQLRLKDDTPPKALVQYHIGEVFVNPSFRLRDTAAARADTLRVDGMNYIAADSSFRPRAVLRSVFLQPGQLYSRKAYSTTITRLMGMGVFRYVNVRFDDTIRNGRGLLNTFVYMTPSSRRTLQLELEAVTKSNNYTGPALTASFKNRNLFRGAELLLFNFHTNYETQFSGRQKGVNSYEVGFNTQLYLPRFITPFTVTNVSSTFLPRTKFDLGFRNLNRVQYFNMNAFNFTYGYTWKETSMKEHELNPLAINFARVKHTTAAFDQLISNNPYLRKSFEEQFTVGGNYSFTFNSLLNNIGRREYYFNGIVEVSGNALSAVNQLIAHRPPSDADPFQLFGYRYSQYSKLSTDTRYYITFNKNSRIATRLLAGAGVPYGNSRTMPYVKQFFSGGSNSIRAFLPRTVGPGQYLRPDSIGRSFLDQAGDIKLEGNIEYRFTMISVLKGAVFLDAGNVWLMRRNDQFPGGEFRLREFYRQLAVGTGFGVRLDVTYFVLRLDLGMALRRPSLPYGERWVINRIDLRERDWRRQNLVLNIAIGYPF